MPSFEQDGVVSLWVFREQEDPANADKDVLNEFCGVEYYDLDSQEGVVGNDAQPLKSLLGQLSYSESFINDALSSAEQKGIKQGFGVIAQFDFAYDPALVTKPIANDPVFLGCFQWREGPS